MPDPGCAAGQGFRTGSARCLIRSVAAPDLDPLYAIATDPAVAPMLLLFSPGMSRAQIAGIFPPGADCPPFRAAVDMDGRTVGSIGVSAGARPSIVYFLAPAVSGRGLASEIVPAFIAALAHDFGLRALRADVFVDNPASLRVLEKAGFIRTGRTMLRSAARPAAAPAWVLERGAD